jgi:hypothetical protein
MTSQIIGYIIIILLATIMFQRQLTVASQKDGKDNQTIKSQSVIPESYANSNTSEPTSETTPIPEEQPNDDVDAWGLQAYRVLYDHFSLLLG